MNVKTYIIKKESPATANPPAIVLSDEQLSKYRRELNAEQLEAVTTTEGPLLVVAGAGTGKTKTLIYRASYLIESGVPPEQILLLTFTRRASQEMLRRAAAVCGEQATVIEGGTFHSYAHGVLRQYAAVLGLSNSFSILDGSDARDTIGFCRAAIGFHEKEMRFPREAAIQAIVSASINKQLPISEIVAEEYPQFVHLVPEIQQLSQYYADYKRGHHMLDYDDLLVRLQELLEKHPAVARSLSSGWRYIMVDEFQDTNLIQADLVRRLGQVHGNVMAVGDDAQSIYSFRGANYRNILDFPQVYTGCKVIKLEQNYRSTARILEASNYVINQAREKFTKHLYTRREPEGEYPALVVAQDEAFQSLFLAQRVLELREEGVPLNQMAVLMRNGRNSFHLEIELQRRKIPFVKYGGQKLIEAAHIRDYLSYLKVLHNPRDLVSWNRILLLLQGIGPKAAQAIVEWVRTAERPLSVGQAPAPSKQAYKLYELGTLLEGLGGISAGVTATGIETTGPGSSGANTSDGGHSEAELSKSTAGRAGEARTLAVIAEAVRAYYLPLLRQRYWEDADKRESDLDSFLAILGGFSSLERLLAEMALEPIEQSALALPEDKDEEPLVLSTIHSAKGLEWDSVFLISALDGILPSTYSIGDAVAMDEELRLLYVAMTRARNNLYISYPMTARRRSYDTYLTEPSRFLRNMPDDLYERLMLVEQQGAPHDNKLQGEDLPQLPPK